MSGRLAAVERDVSVTRPVCATGGTVAARIRSLVERIEARLDAADDPTRVRVTDDGRKQLGGNAWAGCGVVWRDVPSIAAALLRRGYGMRRDDSDGVPF